MLDSTESNPKISAVWRDLIPARDIVSFRFPLAEDGAAELPKVRPCLVLHIEEIGGERFTLLADGTFRMSATRCTPAGARSTCPRGSTSLRASSGAAC